MKIYEFGCAPQAVKDGYLQSMTLFHGTLDEVIAANEGKDVAIVYGAVVFGRPGHYEFGIMQASAGLKPWNITIPEKTLRQIRSMIALNLHGEAYLLAATALGCEALIKRFSDMNRRHGQLGYLPHDLVTEQYRLYNQLRNYARANMTADHYKLFHSSI